MNYDSTYPAFLSSPLPFQPSHHPATEVPSQNKNMNISSLWVVCHPRCTDPQLAFTLSPSTSLPACQICPLPSRPALSRYWTHHSHSSRNPSRAHLSLPSPSYVTHHWLCFLSSQQLYRLILSAHVACPWLYLRTVTAPCYVYM
jgi:hypothetical protein